MAKTTGNLPPRGRAGRARGSLLARGQIAAEQRQRLMEAMIDLIGRQGYASTTLAEVLTQAEVSHQVFYEHFANKRECFLAAYDAIVAEGIDRVEGAYRGADVLKSPSAGLEALFEHILENPPFARLVLVEIRAVGPAGIARRDQLVGAYERLVRGGLELPAGRGLIPNPLARACVGGLLRVLSTRTQSGTPQMKALLPELVNWSTSYYPAPAAVKAALQDPQPGPPYAGLVGGRAPGTLCPGSSDRRGVRHSRGLSRSFVVHSARDRILDAVANLTAAHGYPTLRVEDIAEQAGVSLHTFYEQFAGKEDAFLVAHEVGHRKGLAITERAYESAFDWPTGVREGIAALFDFLATEPAFAHVALVDALIATSRSAQRSDLAVAAIARLFVQGLKDAQSDSPLPSVTFDAIAGGIFELCLNYAGQGHIAELSEILPVATYFALAPFIGIEEAGRVATEPVAVRLRRS